MQHRLIITKVVHGNRGPHLVTVSRYVNTLLGAMREGTRLLNRGLATSVEIFCPEANRVIKTRVRGSSKWADVEVTNVPTHEETYPPD